MTGASGLYSSSGGISLQSIGLTLGLGLGVSFITVVAFGIAVMRRHTNIAPRCTARHPNTIWRRRRDMYGKSKKRRKVKQKKKVSATTTNNSSSNNHPGVVTNDGSQNGPNNNDKPTLIKRNSSFQDFN
eukprot:scaffold26617_cov62-Skeletonema_dohrnii-CCMP3373.AAC.1